MKNSAFLSLLAAFSCWGAEVKLPPPFATPSSTNRPKVVPKPADAQLHVPDGFAIAQYAEGFEQPRYMTLGWNGGDSIERRLDYGARGDHSSPVRNGRANLSCSSVQYCFSSSATFRASSARTD